MAKIRDTITYPIKSVPNTRDMVIITDAFDQSTKNMYLGTVSALNTGLVGFKEVSLELTSAQVLALVTTPFTIVPASTNPNAFIVPVSILLTLTTVTTAYAFNGADVFSVNYTTPTTGGVFASFTGSFLNSVSQTSIAGSAGTMVTLPVVNQDLVLTGVGNTASGSGDNTLKVTVQYTEMTI